MGKIIEEQIVVDYEDQPKKFVGSSSVNRGGNYPRTEPNRVYYYVAVLTPISCSTKPLQVLAYDMLQSRAILKFKEPISN